MDTMDEGAQPFTRFDPLLRQLLDFHLVELAMRDGSAVFQLSAVAEHRLQELVAPTPDADKLVSFTHRCAECGEKRPTRRRHGASVCDPCWIRAGDHRAEQPPAVAAADHSGLTA
jgi:hypothetical protein